MKLNEVIFMDVGLEGTFSVCNTGINMKNMGNIYA